MKKRYKLGVIGCGFMANAILNSLIQSDFINPRKVIVSDRDVSKLEEVADELGVDVTDDNRRVAEESEFVLFAVKPQNFGEVAAEISDLRVDKVISIMAGLKKNTIKNALGVGLIKVARCMPNLACSVGCGAMGIDMSDFNSNPDDTQFISLMFGNMGTVVSLSEDKLDAVTGISGSGPAYVFMFIDSLIDAGIKQGLTADEARTLAVLTVLGGAEIAWQSDKPLTELLMGVCSKGGTTIEAVKTLEENNFRAVVDKAVDACVRRSKELSE